MNKEIIYKKIEQINVLISELNEWINSSDFLNNIKLIRACERNFQLIIDLAVDINTQILIEKTNETPETYKDSFLGLLKLGIISDDLVYKLIKGVSVRNILVHEYDFEEDYKKFSEAVLELIPYYKEYLKSIVSFLKN
jgi:uncharacterized protein YutE (UPF0331/DUF86 family)